MTVNEALDIIDEELPIYKPTRVEEYEKYFLAMRNRNELAKPITIKKSNGEMGLLDPLNNPVDLGRFIKSYSVD